MLTMMVISLRLPNADHVGNITQAEGIYLPQY